MAARLPVLKSREVLRALQRAGFSIHHQTGSHARLLHQSRPELRVTVPIHTKDLPLQVLKSIIKQAGLSNQQFVELLQQ